MISKNELVAHLLAACPGLEPSWRAFTQDWKDEADPPLYTALGMFARDLVRMLENGDTESLRSTFHAIESLVEEGDPYVREAVVVGLLESLQNLALHTTTSPTAFEAHLLPTSRQRWDELNRFWAGRASTQA